jgi:hypothetical protein
MRIIPLSAQWAINVRDGALALKGSHSMGDGWIFLKSLRDASFNKEIYQMSLLSAGSILLDSTFKYGTVKLMNIHDKTYFQFNDN